jgi:hypothetical protein
VLLVAASAALAQPALRAARWIAVPASADIGAPGTAAARGIDPPKHIAPPLSGSRTESSTRRAAS